LRIGIRIKKLRERENWTQVVLASRLGISQAFISGLESGHYKPNKAMLIALSNVFRIPIIEIYPDIEIPFEK